jgi:hypothetical protein
VDRHQFLAAPKSILIFIDKKMQQEIAGLQQKWGYKN